MKGLYNWSLHLLTTGVSATGLVYFWMKYLLENDDPFSLVNHPWQNLMLHGHVLLSPLLIFAFGVFFSGHVMRKLRNNRRQGRRSGLISLFTFPVMAISGYALQVLTSETALQAALIIHLASGGLFIVIYAAHLVVGLTGRTPALRRQDEAVEKRIAA
ncbi:MAG TPA: hypothetical protein VLU25_02510 [Acidobacteriota bacterium]|nr:hypothetical protein [Acidobacteriota bacterium]